MTESYIIERLQGNIDTYHRMYIVGHIANNNGIFLKEQIAILRLITLTEEFMTLDDKVVFEGVIDKKLKLLRALGYSEAVDKFQEKGYWT